MVLHTMAFASLSDDTTCFFEFAETNLERFFSEQWYSQGVEGGEVVLFVLRRGWRARFGSLSGSWCELASEELGLRSSVLAYKIKANRNPW